MSAFAGIVIHKACSQDDEFHVVDHRNLRSLYFDQGSIQTRIRRNEPGYLVLEYTRAMLLPLLLLKPQKVLLLGLGGGALVNYLHQYSHCTLDVVELNPLVFDIAQRYFDLPDSPRIQVHIENADHFIRHCKQTYDLILVDLFSARGPADLLTQKGFYQRCGKRLSPQGMMAVNLWRASEEVLPETITLMEKALARPVYPVALEDDTENLIALTPGSGLDLSAIDLGLTQAAKSILQSSQLNLAPFIPQLMKYL